MSAYYNEIDPDCAQWLRNLMAAGHIAGGEVDERSIEDVRPDELAGFTQCHFFAGVGVWSRALRLAGWPDDRPVWTGSCPCQPFAAPGRKLGFADERHLWPHWYWLIRQREPVAVFGEQVASPDGIAWLDVVQADMEAAGYAFGPLVLPAAGFGAPHGRHRTFFVAEPGSERREGLGLHLLERGSFEAVPQAAGGRQAGVVADPAGSGSRARLRDLEPTEQRRVLPANDSVLGHAEREGLEGHAGHGDRREESGRDGAPAPRPIAPPGVVGGFWDGAELVWCRDERYRPIEPGTFPLAHGAPNRVGRLRAYGNAIVAPVAAEFIGAYMTASEYVGCADK